MNRSFFRTPYILIIVSVIAVYSGAIHASWHLDDYPNIVNNMALHKSLYAAPGSKEHLFRPVASLTFALNCLVSGENPASYRVVNILLHMATAVLLFHLITKIASFKIRDERTCSDIALLAALLWAIHPIQTQAVTYIVQRMAVLCAFFYAAALLAYLLGRLTSSKKKRLAFWLAAMLFWAMSVGSKENGVLLPASVFLIEIIFFPEKDKRRVILAGGAILLFGLFCVWAAKESIMVGYLNRSFSPAERLLTEPRVLLFYLRLLFLPDISKLSIEHDIIISKGLFNPASTAGAILFIMVAVAAAFFFRKKTPFISFAVLFFFLNHLVESSFIPLELVFEHRNYLPSFFLFLPVASVMVKYTGRRKKRIFLAAGCILIIIFGVSTHTRNLAWRSEKSLWEDALKKAPGRGRPYYVLAQKYYKPAGIFDKALALYRQAYDKRWSSPLISKALTLNGMAGVFFAKKDYDRTIYYCKKALNLVPSFAPALHNIVLAHIKTGNWQEAERAVKRLGALVLQDPEALSKEVVVYLNRDNPEKVFLVAGELSRSKPYLFDLYTAAGFSAMKMYGRAAWYFENAAARGADPVICGVGASASLYLSGDERGAQARFERLVRSVPINNIIKKVMGDGISYHYMGVLNNELLLCFKDKIFPGFLSKGIELN